MTPEERETRRGYLGGSEMAALLRRSDGRRVHPYLTEFGLWASKKHPQPETENAEQHAGKRMERMICDWAADEVGLSVMTVEPKVHPGYDWMRGSADAWLGDGCYWPDGLEAKKCRTFSAEDGWGPPDSGRVPLNYRIQCLWYLEVYGLDTWHLAAYASLSDEFRLYTIERDDKAIERLINIGGDWWHKHIIGDVMPEFDVAAARGYLLNQHSRYSQDILNASEWQADLISRYMDARAREKEAKAEKEAAGVDIMAAIGDDAGIQSDDHRIKWSRFSRSSTNLKQLRIDRPDLVPVLDEYTKEKPSGRLNPSKRKKP